MAKLVVAFFLVLIAISMLQTMAMASHGHGGHHYDQNAHHSAQGGVGRHSTISHACSSVRNAARNACVCPLGIMGTKLFALATTTGRPRKDDPNALEPCIVALLYLCPFVTWEDFHAEFDRRPSKRRKYLKALYGPWVRYPESKSRLFKIKKRRAEQNPESNNDSTRKEEPLRNSSPPTGEIVSSAAITDHSDSDQTLAGSHQAK
ncbi:hypothetical protein V6N12_003257 [Hibiscus sabdariffa]|uniref:Uncharacterized protein n=1 Tax=Hibiscus sabdariffa TaxID=183260 RepID=A0ABR2EBD5_9ROSI